jgi:putative Holliday junction resolvase
MAEKRKMRMTTKPFFTGKRDCTTSQIRGQLFFEIFSCLADFSAVCYHDRRKKQSQRRIPMRIMAIDYGDAHTGIAISDPTGFLAGFTTTINAYRPEVVADQVASLAREHSVEELVLGYPKNMDGSLGPRAEKAQAMGELLKEVTGLPLTLWDERRTTIDAHQILMGAGKNAKKRKKTVDAVAATLILEGYLTYKKSR